MTEAYSELWTLFNRITTESNVLLLCSSVFRRSIIVTTGDTHFKTNHCKKKSDYPCGIQATWLRNFDKFPVDSSSKCLIFIYLLQKQYHSIISTHTTR